MARRKRTGYKPYSGIRRKGYATRAARREGLSLKAWARKHAHDGGKRGSLSLRRGQAARLYLNVLSKGHK